MTLSNVDKIEKLKIFKLKIFSWINPETAKDIIFWCPVRKYSAGETILTQWDESNWEWYILIEWTVSISINNQEITKLKEGEIFWEIALLSEDERSATVVADSDIEVIVLNMDNLLWMLENEDNSINKWIIDRIEANINQ